LKEKVALGITIFPNSINFVARHGKLTQSCPVNLKEHQSVSVKNGHICNLTIDITLEHNEAHGEEVEEEKVADEERNQVLETQNDHLNQEAICFEYSDEEEELEECKDDVNQFQLWEVEHVSVLAHIPHIVQDTENNQLSRIN